jgi:hypothetical protein
MAGSVNKVILVGNLGADPEIRHTQDGRPIANLRVATSETWRDRNTGERREKTEWHRVVIFSEGLAKVVEQYLKKKARESMSRASCRRGSGRTSRGRIAGPPRWWCKASTASSSCWTGQRAAMSLTMAVPPITAHLAAAVAPARQPRRASPPWPAVARTTT